MTKGNFFRYYNKLTGADRTLIFFKYKGDIYIYECHHIPQRWASEHFESKSKGGYQKFRLWVPAKEKPELIKKSVKVATAAELAALPYKNNGHKCEAWLHKVCELGEYTPDSLRFDKGGDVVINGVSYQVKYQNASLTNVNVLHKAQKDARANRSRKEA